MALEKAWVEGFVSGDAFRRAERVLPQKPGFSHRSLRVLISAQRLKACLIQSKGFSRYLLVPAARMSRCIIENCAHDEKETDTLDYRLVGTPGWQGGFSRRWPSNLG